MPGIDLFSVQRIERADNREPLALGGHVVTRDTTVSDALPQRFVALVRHRDTARQLGFVEVEMQASGFPKYGTNLKNPNYALIAEACGAQGRVVNEPDELEEAIGTAYVARQPYVLDVQVNPDELLFPPKIDAAHAWGFSLAKLKEVFVEEEAH